MVSLKIELGHGHVGEHQVKSRWIALHHLKGLPRVSRAGDAITQLIKHELRQLYNGCLVIHKKDAFIHEFDMRSGLQAMMRARPGFIQRDVVHFKGEPAPRGQHGVGGIAAKVDDQLVDLGVVAKGRIDVCGQTLLDIF